MSKKVRNRNAAKEDQAAAGEPRRTGPNWMLLGLSAIGMALAGYLTWTESAGSQLKGCTEGSGCDVVLHSVWGTLLGTPTAQWGLLAYATLAGIALFIKGQRLHWTLGWTVAFFGVCYSAYLTTVSLTILGATCPYCLSSFALMTAIFAVITWQKPDMPVFSWPVWGGTRVAVAAVLIGLLHLNYTGVIGAPPEVEDPTLRALAIHIANSGARMYGASWCPHCQQQKARFGASAHRLPYVECSTGRQGSPQTATCANMNISIYPTWIINGERTEEDMPLERLAELTGFKWPDQSRPAP